MDNKRGSAKVVNVMVVDDTLLYRLLVKEAVEKLPGFKVVATAENGKVALERLEDTPLDIILLDIEMPVMNGLEFLDARRGAAKEIPVLVVSSVTKQGGKIAMEALAKGAVDFLTKPQKDSVEDSRAALLSELEEKLTQLQLGTVKTTSARPDLERRIYRGTPQYDHGAASQISTDVAEARTAIRKQRIEAVAIGISTGGPQALTELLPKLPSGLPPILIVQHMPGPFITALAEKLDTQCELTVREAQHEMPLERGYVYIAPGGWQMSVQRRGARLVATLHDAPAENHCLPAADYLFRGAVEALGKRVLGIVMTGMGNDGAQGLLGIKQAGGIGIAQNEASCTVFGMPKQAIKLGGAHFSLALDEIADAIKALAP